MVDAALLTRGKVEGAAIGIGGTVDLPGQQNDARIWCGSDSTLVVEVDITGTADADLNVDVNPYEADNATIMAGGGAVMEIPPVLSMGPKVSGGHVFFYAQYDVTALEMVRVRIFNLNAGAQTVTRASWRLA